MHMPKPDEGVIARKPEIVEALRRIVPGEGVVDEDSGLAVYESDGLTAYRQRPLVVVVPETTAEVADILHYYGKRGLKVGVGRAAGRGQT